MSSSPSGADPAGRGVGSWVAATVGVLGVIALVLFATSNWIRDRLVATETARLDALVELQLSVTTVHLWLEEYVTGDDVDLSAISDGLTRAATLYAVLVDGGAVDAMHVELPPLPAGAAREAAMAARGHLDDFARITALRRHGFAEGADVGIGSELDAQYDAHYHAFIDNVGVVEASTRAQLADRATLANRLGQTILVAWLGIIVFAVTGLWTRENRRRRAEEALRAKELQLLRAQKMDAVGRLAGGITHDINNYLAAITTNCELVQLDAPPGSPVASKMDAILRVCARISALIEQLIAFSRQHPARREIVDLNALIRDLQSMLTRVIGEDVRLTTRLDAELWSTRIDPSQLEQSLVNLVLNARQAMPEGGTITVETGNAVLDAHYAAANPGVAPGEYVMLAVSDDGPGIDKAIQDRIFEPFFTTKDNATNSGLGLSTTYGNVVQNDGHLALESAAGQGATFRIYLPRAADAPPRQAAGDRTAHPVRRGNEGILLVEDNEEFRGSVRTLLEELGYRVLPAASARDALTTFATRRGDIDLVLTDVVMPGMSGKALADAVRAQDATLPVVFMSGHTADVVLDRGAADGPFDVLKKPFTAAELSRQLDAIFGPQSGH